MTSDDQEREREEFGMLLEDELEYERYKAAQEQERAELEVALWREREAEKVQREVKP